MKVILEKVSSDSDEGARIRAKEITDEIRAAADLLEGHGKKIPVTLKGEEMPTETLMISTDSIYYFESVDKRTYAYTRDECYETKYRLYELEDILGSNYFRCSKALIVNIRKIKTVRSEVGGRMMTELLNGEHIVISRSYVRDLKRKLGV